MGPDTRCRLVREPQARPFPAQQHQESGLLRLASQTLGDVLQANEAPQHDTHVLAVLIVGEGPTSSSNVSVCGYVDFGQSLPSLPHHVIYVYQASFSETLPTHAICIVLVVMMNGEVPTPIQHLMCL